MDLSIDQGPAVRLFPKIELEDGRSLGVKIRQAGRMEVRFDVQVPVEAGQIVVLWIEDEHGENWFRASAVIHWTHPIPGGTSVGVYLEKPLSDELLAWPEWDRRESLRYPLNVEARIWWEGSRTNLPARIANYSVCGLGVICPVQVTLGRKGIIAAGPTLEQIVCVAAVPCWQVQTSEGMMIGFELEKNEGSRFGANALQKQMQTPIEQMISTLSMEQ